MSLVYKERSSDSPYVEAVMQGRTLSRGSTIRPAECQWHMVLVRHKGRLRAIVVGPWTTAGVASWEEGAEILWIKFKLGTFMPHLPMRDIRDTEMTLPQGTFDSFTLNASEWQFPNYENVETFVEWLAREEVLVRDPLVNTALQGYQPGLSPRTLRHRFLRATGLTQSQVRQAERAQRAVALLEQGVPIVDAAFESGYYDQPHLTRSLQRFIGYTPAQIAHSPDAG